MPHYSNRKLTYQNTTVLSAILFLRTKVVFMAFSLKSIPLNNSFISLGEDFISLVAPTPFKSKPTLLHFNKNAAELLSLTEGIEQEQAFVDVFSGRTPLQDAKPFAMLYAGHQFGHFNLQLGDGRAIIISEVLNKENHNWELQIKGCGLTPYSRDGDARAVLRSTIRVYLCSEAAWAWDSNYTLIIHDRK